MQTKLQTIFVSFLVLFVFWTSSTCAQSEELRRPTRPDSFNSPEEVAQYVKQLQDYFRQKSVRFGKRFAPLSSKLLNLQKTEELEAADEINELNKQLLERNMDKSLPSEIYLSSSEEEDENNPQEQLARQQMMKALPPPIFARAPLPLLARYLHARSQHPQLRFIKF